MAEVLSQNEVESLLAALEPESTGSTSTASTHSPTKINFPTGQISVYDFKRPERVSKDQMRAFQALHEGFSREFGASLSGMLRSIVEVKLISVDQLTYSEFIFSLENPTCFNLLQSKGLEGSLILDLNPSIIFPIVDRLLGGGKASTIAIPNRPLTEIELRLASRITSQCITALEHAWKNICDLGLIVTQVESNPQLVQIVPPNEVIVLISFEITISESRGIMNLCIPFNAIEPLAGKLSSDSWTSYSKKQIDDKQKAYLESGVKSATVGVVVNLAETTLSAGELANLNVGDVIMTETDQNVGIEVLVEDRPMFHAQPGVLKGHKAFEVTDIIENPRDLVDAEIMMDKKASSQPAEKAETPAEAQKS